MSGRLLDFQPKELNFIFELKKQSSCSVHLVNNTHEHVAFKVKTTSPKKYCVRPNVGIIRPKSTCEFTVTMQAQRTAPLDMVCKDKFLIQSTIVPAGTADEDITSSMFGKDSGNYVEENKLRVNLASPPSSPALSPINGVLKEGLPHGDSQLKDQNGALKEGLVHEISELKDKPRERVDSFSPQRKVMKDVEESREVNVGVSKPEIMTELKEAEELDLKAFPRDLEESREVNKEELEPRKITEFKQAAELEQKIGMDVKESELVKDMKTVMDGEGSKLVKDIEEMKSKLNELELKLGEAQVTISKLTEERKISMQEIKLLQVESRKRVIKRVQVGFPALFVCMVALCSALLGYLSHY